MSARGLVKLTEFQLRLLRQDARQHAQVVEDGHDRKAWEAIEKRADRALVRIQERAKGKVA